MKIVITESQYNKLVENESDEIIKCNQCGWKWKRSEGGKDPLVCHQCGHDNDPKSKFGQPKWVKCRNCKKRFTQTVMRNGKKSLPICHYCGTHNQDIDEVEVYDFNDPTTKIAKHKKRRDYNLLKKDVDNTTFLKKVGNFDFYYSVLGEENEIVLYVIDPTEKTMVAKASFFMVNADDIEAATPYVDPEYRNMGLGSLIYRTALDFGNVVSGNRQSQYAVGLWKKLYRDSPDKVIAVDRSTNKEYPVTLKDGHLVIDSDNGPEIYGDNLNIILKLEK